MNVIVCVDDSMGMLFNHRRVSSDEIVTNRIKEIAGDKLWITEFSSDLFSESARIDSEMLLKAKEGDFCLVENIVLAPYVDQVENLYIFHWNRKYPSDFKLDVDITKNYVLYQSEDFVGKSHKNITMEVYRRA